jgi:hypothetical protein
MADTFLQYQISTGQLTTYDSTGTASLIGTGYAGNGSCLNDPTMTWVVGHGPLPVGRYYIQAPQDLPGSVGMFALRLDPDPANDMKGRSGFFIHGDNPEMDHSASDGCIVAARPTREICATFGVIEVIA